MNVSHRTDETHPAAWMLGDPKSLPAGVVGVMGLVSNDQQKFWTSSVDEQCHLEAIGPVPSEQFRSPNSFGLCTKLAELSDIKLGHLPDQLSGWPAFRIGVQGQLRAFVLGHGYDAFINLPLSDTHPSVHGRFGSHVVRAPGCILTRSARDEFASFLTTALRQMARFSHDGSMHYICMDFRHIGELLEAGEAAYEDFKNLCVWDKQSGGRCQTKCTRW